MAISADRKEWLHNVDTKTVNVSKKQKQVLDFMLNQSITPMELAVELNLTIQSARARLVSLCELEYISRESSKKSSREHVYTRNSLIPEVRKL